MAPMPSSPLKNHSEGDKVKLHPEDSSSTKTDIPGPKPIQPSSFPTPIQIYYSPKLQTVTTKAGFNTWIREFISVLKDYNLVDIIPGPRGKSIRSASTSERQNILATLHLYVKNEFLPAWFFDTTDNIYESVRRAMQLQQGNRDTSQLWSDMKALSYDGTTDAFPFVSKVRSIIRRFPSTRSPDTISLMKTAILSSLHGKCLTLVKKYDRLEESFTIDQLLDDIQYEYDFDSKHRTLSSTSKKRTPSASPDTCRYCHKPGHTIDQCYTKQNQENNKKTSKPKRNVKKSNHIVSTSSSDSNQLRPTSTSYVNNAIVPLDHNDDTSDES